MSCDGNPLCHSTNFAECTGLQEGIPDLHGVFSHSWLDAAGLDKKGNPSIGIAWIDLDLICAEEEKDWIFGQVLLTYRPPTMYGQEPTPLPSYMRGLPVRTSYSLHISKAFPINYLYESQMQRLGTINSAPF